MQRIPILRLALFVSLALPSGLAGASAGDTAPVGEKVRSDVLSGVLGTNRIALEIQRNEDKVEQVVAYIVTREAMSFAAESVQSTATGFSASFSGLGAQVNAVEHGTGYSVSWTQPGFQANVEFAPAEEPLVQERKRVTALGVHPRAPLATAQFAFLVGEWRGKKERLGPDGSYVHVGTIDWKADWILDGMAIQNTSQSHGLDGSVTQWGVDTRIYNARERQWNHQYMSALGGNFIPLTWRQDADGVLVSSMTSWQEPNGKFADHIIHIEVLDADHFRWTADLSWDAGLTWIYENQVELITRLK